jgi:adenylate cyclase
VARATTEQRAPQLYWPAVLLVALIIGAAFYARLPLLDSLRHLAFDAYQRVAPAPALPDSPIRVIHIDEASLASVGQWPWSRATMAQLTQAIGEAGAAAIVFDVLFAEPDRTSPEHVLASAPPAQRDAVLRALGGAAASHDALFASMLERYPTVLAASLHDEPRPGPFPTHAGFAVAGDDPAPFLRNFPGVTASLPALTEAAEGVGFINWLPDGDQVVRRVPLLLRHRDEITPSLSLEALRVTLGASTYVVRAANASASAAFGAHTGLNGVKVGPVEIPTDAEGHLSWCDRVDRRERARTDGPARHSA